MNRKNLAFYAVLISIILFTALPLSLTEFAYRLPIIRDMRIFFDKQLDSIKNSLLIIKDLKKVGERNRVLEREISRLQVKLLLNEGIKRENEELSKLLKIKDTYSKYTIIPARILSYSTTNPNKITVYFPNEYKKYMAHNATVVSSMGLVGLVSSFAGNNAEVELITSKQFSIPAVLESREECTSILKGNGQSLSILFLDRVCNKPKATGKKMLSANLSQNYSLPYIPIGIIGGLKEDESNILFLRGEVIPLYKKGRLNHLFIIVGSGINNEKFQF